MAVLGVTVPLAPGEEEDWLGAGVGLLDGSGDGRHVGEDHRVNLGPEQVRVRATRQQHTHVVNTKTWSLGLILNDHHIKISTPNK